MGQWYRSIQTVWYCVQFFFFFCVLFQFGCCCCCFFAQIAVERVVLIYLFSLRSFILLCIFDCLLLWWCCCVFTMWFYCLHVLFNTFICVVFNVTINKSICTHQKHTHFNWFACVYACICFHFNDKKETKSDRHTLTICCVLYQFRWVSTSISVSFFFGNYFEQITIMSIDHAHLHTAVECFVINSVQSNQRRNNKSRIIFFSSMFICMRFCFFRNRYWSSNCYFFGVFVDFIMFLFSFGFLAGPVAWISLWCIKLVW